MGNILAYIFLSGIILCYILILIVDYKENKRHNMKFSPNILDLFAYGLLSLSGWAGVWIVIHYYFKK